MFCDTLLVFQSIKVQEIQWSGCVLSNVEEHGGKCLPIVRTNSSENDLNPSGELRKLSRNPYKRAKNPMLYIT